MRAGSAILPVPFRQSVSSAPSPGELYHISAQSRSDLCGVSGRIKNAVGCGASRALHTSSPLQQGTQGSLVAQLPLSDLEEPKREHLYCPCPVSLSICVDRHPSRKLSLGRKTWVSTTDCVWAQVVLILHPSATPTPTSTPDHTARAKSHTYSM